MKSYLLSIVVFFSFCLPLSAQLDPVEVLKIKKQLAEAKEDTTRMRLLSTIAIVTRFSDIDTALRYVELAMEYAKRLDKRTIEIRMLSLKGAIYLEAGRIPEALESQLEVMRLGERIDDNIALARAYNGIGNIYMELGDYAKANEYYFISASYSQKSNNSFYFNELSNIGNIYTFLKMPDSSLFFLNKVYKVVDSATVLLAVVRPELLYRIGNAYNLKGDSINALTFYHFAIEDAMREHDLRNTSMASLLLAKYFEQRRRFDSTKYYAYWAISAGRTVGFKRGTSEAALILNELFRNEMKFDSAYKYLSMAVTEKESLFGSGRLQELQKIFLKDKEEREEADKIRVAKESRQKQYALLSALAVFLIIAGILMVNNRQKKKANQLLQVTVNDLRATQSQLIQSEKMASLGELTAGIAHEIQNPLNFVNNFSELNTELIEELRVEADKGNLEEVRKLVAAIEENETKINHHGKRADSIVKSMLQHSRTGTGVKESVDINALADEFARLAYHGLRAREKNFNASIETSFDNTLGKVTIVSQDIGRVFLNVINNAFYAMAEKKKREPAYSPVLKINTIKKPGFAEIHIADNGSGIPAHAMEKIFQPFFTTKPTGAGTGLGLSLSYDIITKTHGGQIKVETEEGKGTEFIIRLPLS